MVRGFSRLRSLIIPTDGRMTLPSIVIVVVIAALLGVAVGFSGVAQRLEWGVYDRYMSLSARRWSSPDNMVIIAIDEPSFAEVGLRWPWPRSIHAALLESLRVAGARRVVMDIIFDTPSDEFDDSALAEALASPLPVVLAGDIRHTSSAGYVHRQTILPEHRFLDTGVAVGLATVYFDPDNMIRRASTLVAGHPTIAYATYLENDAVADFEPATFGSKRQRPLLRFYGGSGVGIDTVSFYQALAPDTFLPSGVLDGKTVFVGLSVGADADVTASADVYGTPVGPRTAGVEIQATAYANMVADEFVAEPFRSGWSIALFALLVAFFLSHPFVRAPLPVSLAMFVVVAAGALIAGYLFLDRLNLRVPVIHAILAVGSVFIVVSVYRGALGAAERRFITGAFKHYLAPSVVDEILDDPSKLSLGGELREVTVLFTDLVGFTTISESLAPEMLTELLRSYFREMLAVLREHSATLDKFIGDAIMAFFGAPVATPEHADLAVSAARGMQLAMEGVNSRNAARGLPELVTRIGIHTGLVVAGNMGTEEVFNYTVMGDNVNLASRLEGVNKEYGTRTIAAAATVDRLTERSGLRLLDSIRVKGKTEPVEIFEVVARPPASFETLRASYEEALVAYRAGDWPVAGERFRSILEVYEDGPSRAMLDRCLRYAVAPPAEWDGVHVMTSK